MSAGSVLRHHESPIFRKYRPRGDDYNRKNDAVAIRGAVIENWWQHVSFENEYAKSVIGCQLSRPAVSCVEDEDGGTSLYSDGPAH